MKINIEMELALRIIIKMRKIEIAPLIDYKQSNISKENKSVCF